MTDTDTDTDQEEILKKVTQHYLQLGEETIPCSNKMYEFAKANIKGHSVISAWDDWQTNLIIEDIIWRLEIPPRI